MDNIKNIIVGGVVTLLIGGTAYTFTQQDVINNFSEDTGMTQEEATEYVTNMKEEDMVSFAEVGNDYLKESKNTQEMADSLDCENYEYGWETPTLTCVKGKSQLEIVAAAELALSEAYIKLDTDVASQDDMREVISRLDALNQAYELEVSVGMFEAEALSQIKTTNSFNKSLIKAALEGEQS
ncbi:MAG: hypothetical protein RLZZ360_332 [Candidatus Parcubacteria bacterium]|jgi:polyhydroxyalkanoate synthesis regulator phasin